MKYAVYRQWNDSKLQEVLDYFSTIELAEAYKEKVKRSSQYTVHVGIFTPAY